MNELESFLPYGRQMVDASDVDAVAETLCSDWLTTGPKVAEFERAWAEFCRAGQAVAVVNGTAALHSALAVLNLRPGDGVVVSPMTFAASANSILYAGGEPVFADVDPGTLLLDADAVAEAVRRHGRVRAVVSVDYAGQPCDYDAIRAAAPGVTVVADACHSPGAMYKERPVGTLADMTCFSFHPVKHLTTGEGGAVVTDSPELAAALRIFRNHGIDTDHRQRAAAGSWFYDMKTLGYNYRLTDIQCSLGLSQLAKLPKWLSRRRELAAIYGSLLAGITGIEPLAVREDVVHAWHLYVVRIRADFGLSRDCLFEFMLKQGIGANVHYRPVHLHSYYRDRFGFGPGLCPVAEAASDEILTLPLWPGMADRDVERVVAAIVHAGSE